MILISWAGHVDSIVARAYCTVLCAATMGRPGKSRVHYPLSARLHTDCGLLSVESR